MELTLKPGRILARSAHHRLRLKKFSNMKLNGAQKAFKWNSVMRDPLPNNGQQVLLHVEGVYYIAAFDAVKALFRIEDELLQTVFRLNGRHFCWRELADANS